MQLGQWRYENGMANWKGPRFACSISTVAAPVPAKIKSPQVFDGDKAVKPFRVVEEEKTVFCQPSY